MWGDGDSQTLLDGKKEILNFMQLQVVPYEPPSETFTT